MARISVIVPAYNVEEYLADCLDSVLDQRVDDLEVVVVDDGSTDTGPLIARRFADRDDRIRLIRQANHGLGHARNTGIAAAAGEFLAFVDSDDRLPEDALARLLSVLDATGSDFATGNIHRFNNRRTWPAAFVRKTFWRGRQRTHVTRFRWLLHDRMAQNKLWRRSFWDEHALRFPEACLHEDIPLVIPAHFMARSVDVVSAPVYLYREREDGSSITQHRAALRTLDPRVAACEQVREYLAHNGPPGARRQYDETLVSDDLRYHLDVLGNGDAEYRAAFMAHAGRVPGERRPGCGGPPAGDAAAQVAARARGAAGRSARAAGGAPGARQRDRPPGPPRPTGSDRAAARSGAAAGQPPTRTRVRRRRPGRAPRAWTTKPRRESSHSNALPPARPRSRRLTSRAPRSARSAGG